MAINVREAKANFSKLLQRIAVGEEVIISKAGVPVAKLVPIEQKPAKRKLGLYRGRIWMADDFDAPMQLSADEPPKKARKRRAEIPPSGAHPVFKRVP